MIVIERIVTASADRVWEVLTTTESIKQWWGPTGFTAPVIHNDFREGGTLLWSMEAPPEYPRIWNVGRYREILLREKIVFSMSFSDETGQVIPAAQLGMPGDWPDSISVTIELHPQAEQTRITVTEIGIPPEMAEPARLGWVQQLDKVASLVNP